MLIAPSILNANNLNLKPQIAQAIDAGITRFHIDIMDGHFVPNLSFGPQLVMDFKKEFPSTKLEIHLMSNNPKDLVPAFVKAGADLIELHYEAMSEEDLDHWLDYIKSNDVKTSLVLNPDTNVEVINKFATKLDQILLMTVYPGFGGQKFIPESKSRIKAVNQIVNSKIPIEVDGGINDETAKAAIKSGASILVAGSFIFSHPNIAQQIKKLEAK